MDKEEEDWFTWNPCVHVLRIFSIRYFDEDRTVEIKRRETHIVGHKPIDFAQSDGPNLIAKQTVRVSRGNFPLKTDVFSSFK